MAVYRNANILLIFLILLNLIVITGTFIFFQKSFETIQSRYEAKTDSLNQIEAEVATKYKNLQIAQKEIRAKLQSENVTAARYTEVSALKANLETEAGQLEDQKKQLNAELSAQSAQTADIKAKAALALARQGQIKTEIGIYNEEIRRIDYDISRVQSEIAIIQKKISTA
ncbi:MAG: hypothetical protein AABX47_08835 [Nanoarchaeota archaeon]